MKTWVGNLTGKTSPSLHSIFFALHGFAQIYTAACWRVGGMHTNWNASRTKCLLGPTQKLTSTTLFHACNNSAPIPLYMSSGEWRMVQWHSESQQYFCKKNYLEQMFAASDCASDMVPTRLIVWQGLKGQAYTDIIIFPYTIWVLQMLKRESV